MDALGACEYINKNFIYKPKFSISATIEDRFDSAIRLHIKYTAPDYSQEHAPHYEVEVEAHREAILLCYPGESEFELEQRVFHEIMQVEHHEAREAFRVGPDWHAPFHPHKLNGIEAWGDHAGDIKFGVA